ncbi:hypothetical protein ACFFX0_26295 [Citricoccus parietis]|uniref:Uncharacterized protein n=1 Tax=Citricoccus parietis TaxID=592307 RepID=A0ABV5G6C8_9MICC
MQGPVVGGLHAAVLGHPPLEGPHPRPLRALRGRRPHQRAIGAAVVPSFRAASRSRHGALRIGGAVDPREGA